MIRRTALYEFSAVLAASAFVLAGVLYAEVTQVYDTTTLFVSVLLPVAAGSALLWARKERIALFAFLSLFWAVIDDAPVFFDSVLTWPEVTRFNPFLPRLYMNIVIHALTILFLYLMIHESLRGTGVRLRNAPGVVALASAAFIFAYAQNIPLAAIQNAVESSWFPFDVAEKSASILCLCLAVWKATRLREVGGNAGEPIGVPG